MQAWRRLVFVSAVFSFFAHAECTSARNGIEKMRTQQNETNTSECRCFPGTSCWPSDAAWAIFNDSVHGGLISTIPIASPCHDGPLGTFNAQKCAELQSTWFLPETHLTSSSSIMAPLFTNNSCNPFLPRTSSCEIGNLVRYTVNASDLSDVQKTVNFARQKNIRLTIRNTGHDYNGKATGAGAIAVWMHNLKSIEILQNYTSPSYTGKALKIGAGVLTLEAYQYAHNHGLVVVGGNSPTVGMAGGYIQGGGHSPLSSKYGLAADQALEWEVITANGDHLTASPSQNADLYWALSGGGGGTYAVVVALTIKVYPDMMNSAGNLTFSSSSSSSTTGANDKDDDGFWDVVRTFQQSLPTIVDAGAVAVFSLTNESFTLGPLQGPGISKVQLEKLLDPTVNKIKQNKIQYSEKTLRPYTDMTLLKIHVRFIH